MSQPSGSPSSTVVPPQPLTESRPSKMTVPTSEGMATPSNDRVKGCSLAWWWSNSRTPKTVPLPSRTLQASA